ncbi:hypothetical protein [Brevibacillus sp. SAFN-007a]
MEPLNEAKPASSQAVAHEKKDLPDAWKRFLQAVQTRFSEQKPPAE